jgi:hypothetical protein
MNAKTEVALALLDAAKTLCETDAPTAQWYIELAEKLLGD